MVPQPWVSVYMHVEDMMASLHSDLYFICYSFSAHGATALGKRVYACGGYDGVSSLRSVEVYCQDTDR